MSVIGQVEMLLFAPMVWIPNQVEILFFPPKGVESELGRETFLAS